MIDTIEVPHIKPHSTFIEKALAISAILAAISVPIATSYIAAKYAEQSTHRQGDVRMVELAVGILQQEPKPATESIRAWALDVLDQYSGVKISKGARQALVKSESLPGRTISVPSITGLSVSQAEAVAAAQGLRTVIKGPLTGTVVSQSPSAGTAVQIDSTIFLQTR